MTSTTEQIHLRDCMQRQRERREKKRAYEQRSGVSVHRDALVCIAQQLRHAVNANNGHFIDATFLLQYCSLPVSSLRLLARNHGRATVLGLFLSVFEYLWVFCTFHFIFSADCRVFDWQLWRQNGHENVEFKKKALLSQRNRAWVEIYCPEYNFSCRPSLFPNSFALVLV